MVNKVLALLVVVAVAGVAFGSLWLLDKAPGAKWSLTIWSHPAL